MAELLHMTSLAEWRGRDGALAPASLLTEGFAHASPDWATMLAVANAFYTEAEPQVVLVLDPDLLDAEVRWEAAEPAPPPGVPEGVRFPHVYGPIPERAVTAVRYPRRDAAGRYLAFEERCATAEALDLLPHPEGGWFRQTWASPVGVRPEGYTGERPCATGILFLLRPGETSDWHRVRSEEMWVFTGGGPLELATGGTGPRPVRERSVVLGPDLVGGDSPQFLVPAGTWQSAAPRGSAASLVSCFVAPGFDFADFEMADVAPD
ncbi:hypothetical protein CLV63_102241 [Murinocardiopsis flavida]|uniref:DUF985 domain-containing protein n=1 Tax=Murinocardiopsis flavida TaxID=645275 RepID=A0A2P8DSE6_9ACTN|nr:cupin domain-containing protein [Murinocardiopsis flavida]PSL00115.1 hypothetical protein CLV63_102241 [Murinocardiopsis flavida]